MFGYLGVWKRIIGTSRASKSDPKEWGSRMEQSLNIVWKHCFFTFASQQFRKYQCFVFQIGADESQETLLLTTLVHSHVQKPPQKYASSEHLQQNCVGWFLYSMLQKHRKYQCRENKLQNTWFLEPLQTEVLFKFWYQRFLVIYFMFNCLTLLFQGMPGNLGRTLSGKHATPGRAGPVTVQICLRDPISVWNSTIADQQMIPLPITTLVIVCRSEGLLLPQNILPCLFGFLLFVLSSCDCSLLFLLLVLARVLVYPSGTSSSSRRSRSSSSSSSSSSNYMRSMS